jgi:serine/threonine protein kinase
MSASIILCTVLQAILDVKYQFPKGLTRECRDLIRGLFQKDPNERLTVAEIKKHPWFKSHLPEELSVSAAVLVTWYRRGSAK